MKIKNSFSKYDQIVNELVYYPKHDLVYLNESKDNMKYVN